jgi:hypothetical protein
MTNLWGQTWPPYHFTPTQGNFNGNLLTTQVLVSPYFTAFTSLSIGRKVTHKCVIITYRNTCTHEAKDNRALIIFSAPLQFISGVVITKSDHLSARMVGQQFTPWERAFLVRKLAATTPANNWTSSGRHLDVSFGPHFGCFFKISRGCHRFLKCPGDELVTFRKSLQHPLDTFLMSLEGTKVTLIWCWFSVT